MRVRPNANNGAQGQIGAQDLSEMLLQWNMKRGQLKAGLLFYYTCLYKVMLFQLVWGKMNLSAKMGR